MEVAPDEARPGSDAPREPKERGGTVDADRVVARVPESAQPLAAPAAEIDHGAGSNSRGAEEAQEFGLKVSTDMPEDVLQLMSLYHQPVRQQAGGVEYVPAPRQRPVATRT